MGFIGSSVSGWLGRRTVAMHSLGDAGSFAGGITGIFPTHDLFESSHNSHNYCNHYSNFTDEETEVQKRSVICQGHSISD